MQKLVEEFTYFFTRGGGGEWESFDFCDEG